MKLSEAILKGCEMTPKQAFGWAGEPGKETCAIRAGYEGAGMDVGQPVYEFERMSYEVAMDVTRLNDDERWSRERIASWLAEKGL